MGTIRGQYGDNSWKSKLRVSQSEKKYLRKCLARKNARIARLVSELKALKVSAEVLRKQLQATTPDLGVVPFEHQFPVVVMYLAVFFQVNLGLSYRQSSAVLGEFLKLLGSSFPSPSYSSIRVWRIAAQVHKMAFYVLQSPILDDGLGQKWALVVDESATIGKEKVLTVLATPLVEKEFPSALCAAETQVLTVKTGYS